MNKSLFGGIGLAIAGICLGLYFDGGKIGQLLQPTAALIVFGGTLGAVLVQFPFSVIVQAAKQLPQLVRNEQDLAPTLVHDLTRYAIKARRSGVVSLDSELEAIQDPFLKQALTLAVDGTHPAELRERMELEMDIASYKEGLTPKVFEAAGGFSPTIGILGAVIGLIQVMQRLQDINEVGKGIAVAFVATIYGVGSANLLFLPCAGRIRILMRRRQMLRELVLDGVMSIVERMNPRFLESKLAPYLIGSTVSPRDKVVSM